MPNWLWDAIIGKKKEAAEKYPLVPDVIDLRYRIDPNRLKKMNVLNVGVGVGNSGLSRQLVHLPFKRLDNIDVYQPYLNRAMLRSYAAKIKTFTRCDAREFDMSRYDLVMMFDVLEHLPKEDSLKIIDEIEGEQLIFIPLETEYRENNFEAEAQEHLSFWEEDDFKIRGFETEVLYGFHRDDKNVWDALWAWKGKKEKIKK